MKLQGPVQAWVAIYALRNESKEKSNIILSLVGEICCCSVAADIFILLPSIATLIIHDIKARSIAAAMHDFYQKLYEGREDNSNNSNQVKTSSH